MANTNINVDLPGYGLVEFPEGTSEEDINSAITGFLKEREIDVDQKPNEQALKALAPLGGTQVRQPMGPMGPPSPEEVLALPQVTKIPSALLEKSGISQSIGEAMADFRRRTGIDPSAEPGVPAMEVDSLPIARLPLPRGGSWSPIDLISPEFRKGIEAKAGQMLSGLTAPGMTELLPLGGAKPVQALFGAESLAAVPLDVEQALKARSAGEAGQAVAGGLANLGIGASIGAHLLPGASKIAADTLGVPDALEPEATPTVRTVQPQPQQSARQMPAQSAGQEAGVGGRKAPVAQEAQVPLNVDPNPKPMSRAALLALDQARAETKAPVDVVEQPLGENEPFAHQIATIDRATGRIKVNGPEFSAWLEAVPEEHRPEAVRALISEESIHLGVEDADAGAYWNNLTAAEKAIQKYRYTGNWAGKNVGSGQIVDPLMLGHEAIRFRIQQLQRMTPREIAEAAGKERWSLQAITAMESIIRKVRETIGTKASKEQSAMLDRIQANLDIANKVASGAAPGAIRRGKDTGEQDFMFLPPPEPGPVERSVFASPTPKLIEAAATDHFENAIKAGRAPSFENFQNELKGQFGSGISKDAVYYTWQDAMMKRLMNAPGAEIDSMLDQLGIRKETEYRKTPDAMQMPPEQMEIGQISRDLRKAKWRTAREWRQRFGPEQQRRYTAIGAIIDKLTREQGEAPKRAWSRTDIGPEDVAQRFTTFEGAKEVQTESGATELTQPEIETKPMFRTFGPDEMRDPNAVAEIATRGAAVDATGKDAPPRSVSKNLIALRAPTGKIILASVWKEPRTGARVTNLEVPSGESQRLGQVLPTYRPVAVMTLREPAKGFHKVFENQEAFDKYFGDIAIEGTPGIKSSMFAGPEAGITESQAGIRGGTPQRPPEGGLPPSLTEKEVAPSETLRELTAPERAPVPSGRVLYRSPRPSPPQAEKLPVMQQRAIEQAGVEAYPYEPTRYLPQPPLGPSRMGGPRFTGVPPKKPTLMTFEKEAGRKIKNMGPGAIRRQSSDLVEGIMKALDHAILRMGSKGDIYRLRDAADHEADRLTYEAKNTIIAVSEPPLKGSLAGLGQDLTRAEAKERGRMNRIGAIAWVVSQGKRNKLKFYDDHINAAQQRIDRWRQDPNPIKRREAEKDQKYVDQLRAGLKWARDNWDDPIFQRTGKAIQENLKTILDEEKAGGKNITEYEGYYPGVYEGDFWNSDLLSFASKKLLGEQYRMPKKFHDPFEAIADGSYRLGSVDAADMVAHRMRQGYRWLQNNAFYDSVKSIRDRASGEPIGLDAVPVFKDVLDPDTGTKVRALVGYKSPKPGYEVVGHNKIAIMTPYKQALDWATSPSRIDQITIGGLPVGKTALIANQLLKHNVVLLWDTFHPGRLLQYASALSGVGDLGYRGGYTALSFTPEALQHAVASGRVTQAAADWANGKVTINNRGRSFDVTRRELLAEAVRNGFNAKRFTDELYRDAIQSVPIIGEPWHKIVGPYNHWLFDQMIPGLMAETFVKNFEKLHANNPNVPYGKLMKDVIKDTNIFFGNMGRQGIFKSRTSQDLGRLLLLAPLWQEGLFNKELRFATRSAAGLGRMAGLNTGYRQGLPGMGALGNGMGKGLLTYFIGTQLINLISRGKPTWENPEQEHKLDAWVPTPWQKTGGFWLSPLSVFAEVTHDLIRLGSSKPKFQDALMQIGSNRASPVGKMLLSLVTGMDERGQQYATTARWLGGTAKQLTPFAGPAPITFSVPMRELAHAVAPTKVSPNQPGAWTRQALASFGGIKTEVPQTKLQEAGAIVRRFIEKEGLEKSTGWKQVQTDDPGYSKLRTAIRLGDEATATKMLKELRKNRSDADITKAMMIWAKRPWTGSHQNEESLMMKATPEQLNTLHDASVEKMQLLNSFYDLLYKD